MKLLAPELLTVDTVGAIEFYVIFMRNTDISCVKMRNYSNKTKYILNPLQIILKDILCFDNIVVFML